MAAWPDLHRHMPQIVQPTEDFRVARQRRRVVLAGKVLGGLIFVHRVAAVTVLSNNQ